MNDINEEYMYNSEKILNRISRRYENKSIDDGDEYVDERNEREYEMIYLMNNSDYDGNFL